jgi:hypothetical protein
MSIMDTAKSLAHGIIEVDAAHWNRYAFLVCFYSKALCRVHKIILAALLAHFPHWNRRLQKYPP